MLMGLCLLLLAGCDSGDEETLLSLEGDNADECLINPDDLRDGGVPKDGIPALTDPRLVGVEEAIYLTDASRIIGFFVDGQAIAVPHNILWWHEITNFNFDSLGLAVTYCPLTGSSMAFDRAVIGGGEFGVSGLLFQNNLTMYDRTSQESLWPQMSRTAGCGARTGAALTMYPVVEMTWGGWKALHPDTRVISGSTGHSRNYTESGYPYGDYEGLNNRSLLFSQEIDGRRPPKERLLGIPGANGGGIAFPFGILDDNDAPVRAVHETVDGDEVVVFWHLAYQGAVAFRPFNGGQRLTFAERDGQIVDEETGSTWRVDGRATDGPLAGTQLEPVADAYVAFWFAWATFQPETRLWEGS